MRTIVQPPVEQALNANTQRIADLESKISRILLGTGIVLLLLMLPIIDSVVRFVVSLKSESAVWSWTGYASLTNWLFALLLCSPLITWVWITSRDRKSPANTRLGLLSLPACIGVGLVILSLAWDHSRVQWLYIETSKVRLVPASFPRSLMFWRSADLKESWQPGNTVALLGSSQMNFAVDRAMLQKALPGTLVVKRALPGLGIMQYALLRDRLIKQGASTVICWISEFDTFREESIPANRFRYFATLENTRDLAHRLGGQESWRNRGALADMGTAALCPLWRDRDVTRRVACDFWWPMGRETVTHDPHPETIPGQGDLLKRAIGRTRLVEANFRSFSGFAEQLKVAGIELLVFEGHTQPQAMVGVDPTFRRETRQRIRRIAERCNFIYVDESQMPSFTNEDFIDPYHLGDPARERFTLYLGEFLKHTMLLTQDARE